MLKDSRLKELIIDRLLDTQGASRPKEDDIVVRCPFCGDSVKSLDHGHLHIWIDVNEPIPMIYHCFRCDASGILNKNLLNELEINDGDINGNIGRYNNKMNKVIRNSLSFFDERKPVFIPDITKIETALRKKEYIENRLGVSCSFAEWAELKVVFNLLEVLFANNLVNRLSTSKDKVKELHLDYIGFMSCLNQQIVMRNITDSKNRYYKYSLFGKKYDPYINKLYIIPNQIDALTTEPITINVSEGTFDILGIYFHIFNKNKKNNLFAAACGCGFNTAVKYFLQKGLIGDNITVNIYSDKDKNPAFYKDLFKDIKPLVGHVNLYYNGLSKDCGVRKEDISLTCYQIK